MHADRLRGAAELLEGAVIEIDIRREACGIAADDGEHQRQIVMRGAHHRLRAAADADPGLELTIFHRRIDQLVFQGWTQLAVPRHRLLRQQCGEQVELLLEQLLVVA